jgi:isopenicillin-N N-acyltransferase like protein
MNAAGLTVTLNAAKSEIPGGAALPVSLLARQILQYAENIDEAVAIASKHKTFVSESFLIGSASDQKAAIIEKSPEETAVVYSQNDWIIDTNHFQSKTLGATALNQEHMKTSASVYRYNRVAELLRAEKLSVTRTAAILRDPYGMQGKRIGLGNEKAINQLIAHHSIIFQPEKRLVWISTSPWQLGNYVAYDLNKIFGSRKTDNGEIYESQLTIAADTTLPLGQLNDYLKYAPYRFPFQSRESLNPDSVVAWNPQLYHVYMLAGDHEFESGDYARAAEFYRAGLLREIATAQERLHMQERLKICEDNME